MHRIIGFLLAFAVTASAAQPLVFACATTAEHPCCMGVRIASAPANPGNCCVTRTPRDTGTPAATRVTTVAPVTTAPPVVDAFAAADVFASAPAPRRSPPRGPRVDLPTLFSVLLI